ncbi:MAG: UDP-N-acetylmuramate dehydrogenase [Bdellovibrio sp.]|nr:UDP-N-acetylmuramate dehydrogenase [Bdellovibrio sp.]
MKIKEWFQTHGTTFGGDLLFDEPLAKHTYFRIGGPAQVLAIPKTLEDLKILAQAIFETQSRFFIMGQGSNLLASDLGFDGVVIRGNKLNLKTELVGEGESLRLRTGASVPVSTLLRKCSAEGWTGLEFLTGVPGLLGGVVRMNAGTHLGEAVDQVRKVSVYSVSAWPWAELVHYEGEDLQFTYRRNFFLKPGDFVWEIEWAVSRGDPETVKNKIQEILTRRKSTQPLDYPSCGSVFKNPKSSGLSAWQVVDKLGLRGQIIGGAQFSEKHSNFILNLGNAKAVDVRSLIWLAKTKARAELGIDLEEEVIYLE